MECLSAFFPKEQISDGIVRNDIGKGEGNEVKKRLGVSIVVPVYNAADSLSRCLCSLLGQGCPDMEIICVDDGSTDNSLEILNQFVEVDGRVKVIKQAKSGVSAARNMGLRYARNEIIGFCDADDAYVIGALSEVLSLFQQGAADIVVTGFIRMRGTESQYSCCFNESQRWSSCMLQEYMLYDDRVMGAVWNKFFMREQIRGIMFNEKLTHCEDMHFISQVLHKNPGLRVCVLPNVAYEYHANENSATENIDKLIDAEGRLCYMSALNSIATQYQGNWEMWKLVRSAQFRLIHDNVERFTGNRRVQRRLAWQSICFMFPYIICRKRVSLRQRLMNVKRMLSILIGGSSSYR